MEQIIQITPEQLYYLGTCMKAKYIDYAYVAAMGDIQQQKAIYETEAKASLSEAGYLLEDYSGEIEVAKNVQAMLEPVFFGVLESSVEMAIFRDGVPVQAINTKFHIYEGKIVSVAIGDKQLQVKEMDDSELQSALRNLLLPDYNVEKETCDFRNLEKKKITRTIVLKNMIIGQKSMVEAYIEYDGKVYHESGEDGMIETVTADEFCLSAYQVLKGER